MIADGYIIEQAVRGSCSVVWLLYAVLQIRVDRHRTKLSTGHHRERVGLAQFYFHRASFLASILMNATNIDPVGGHGILPEAFLSWALDVFIASLAVCIFMLCFWTLDSSAINLKDKGTPPWVRSVFLLSSCFTLLFANFGLIVRFFEDNLFYSYAITDLYQAFFQLLTLSLLLLAITRLDRAVRSHKVEVEAPEVQRGLLRLRILAAVVTCIVLASVTFLIREVVRLHKHPYESPFEIDTELYSFSSFTYLSIIIYVGFALASWFTHMPFSILSISVEEYRLSRSNSVVNTPRSRIARFGSMTPGPSNRALANKRKGSAPNIYSFASQPARLNDERHNTEIDLDVIQNSVYTPRTLLTRLQSGATVNFAVSPTSRNRTDSRMTTHSNDLVDRDVRVSFSRCISDPVGLSSAHSDGATQRNSVCTTRVPDIDARPSEMGQEREMSELFVSMTPATLTPRDMTRSEFISDLPVPVPVRHSVALPLHPTVAAPTHDNLIVHNMSMRHQRTRSRTEIRSAPHSRRNSFQEQQQASNGPSRRDSGMYSPELSAVRRDSARSAILSFSSAMRSHSPSVSTSNNGNSNIAL